jgi:hypothetical protein
MKELLMPQNIFNLYSAVAFADHPLATWSLDDDFSFLSLVGASPVWAITNGASATIVSPPKQKPQETVGIGDVGLFTYDFTASASTMTIKSQSFSNVNTDALKPTVCINTFLYTYNSDISSVEIGFEYGATKSYSTYTNPTKDSWTRITHTTSMPNSTSIYPYIKFTFSTSNRTISLYNFSVGQWSESSNHISTGSVPINFNSLSSSASLAAAWGSAFSTSPLIYKLYEADTYGFVDDHGYYVIENNRMLAENNNMPMVYGSGNITSINGSQNNAPSLVFPAKGFLGEVGKNGSYTAEFWMRIAPLSNSPVKIFGPTSNDDGIYVDQNFITINIGPKIKSYFIGKWYRPMLIDFIYSGPKQSSQVSKAKVSLMIDGALVIDESIDFSEIDYQSISNDWVGFYSSDTVIKKFEIDSFSIYPYAVTSNMAKRKFVYGQGVDNINDILRKFGTSPTSIDFSFSNYSKNIMYPDIIPWNAGISSNVTAQARYLELPQYTLPEFIYYTDNNGLFTVNRDLRTWGGVKKYTWSYWKNFAWQKINMSREMELLYDNYENQVQSKEKIYIKMRPNTKYNFNSVISFKSANPINENVASFFGIFSINKAEIEYAVNSNGDSGLGQTTMTLIQFTNKSSNSVFKIIISDINKVSRQFKIKYYIDSTQINSGLEETISYPSTEYDNVYFIAGLDISKVSLYASSEIKNYFKNMSNLELSICGNDKNQFTGRLYRFNFDNQFFTNNYMSNYFDTNGFAKKSTSSTILYTDSIFDYIGNYTLLFKLANKSIVMDIGSSGYWQSSIPMYQLGSYITKQDGTQVFDLDMIQFNVDIPSGFSNADSYDNSEVFNAYVTIQRYQDVGKIPYSNYTEVQSSTSERVVDFNKYSKLQLDVKKFKISNGSIIFPPKSVIDFKNIYLTFHIEIKSKGINTGNFKLQKMSLASLSFDNDKLYGIGTSNGNRLFPFTRQSVSYSSKLNNPFLIYKDSTPYLYLTSDSGIQALPYSDSDSKGLIRGVSIPINISKSSSYNLFGMQLWTLYNNSYSFTEKKKLFGIYFNDKEIIFYIEPESGNKRATITAYEKIATIETQYTNVIYHQNGIKQKIYIEPLKWSMITIEFPTPISFANKSGQLELYSGAVFNNISLYNSSINNIVDDIFESHLGLSNIVHQDSTTISVDLQALDFYSDVQWSNFNGSAT